MKMLQVQIRYIDSTCRKSRFEAWFEMRNLDRRELQHALAMLGKSADGDEFNDDSRIGIYHFGDVRLTLLFEY